MGLLPIGEKLYDKGGLLSECFGFGTILKKNHYPELFHFRNKN